MVSLGHHVQPVLGTDRCIAVPEFSDKVIQEHRDSGWQTGRVVGQPVLACIRP